MDINEEIRRVIAEADCLYDREQIGTAIARLAREPVSQKELERAKNRLDFSFYEGFNSNSEKANFLGHLNRIYGKAPTVPTGGL